jgi:hypothetical protein
MDVKYHMGVLRAYIAPLGGALVQFYHNSSEILYAGAKYQFAPADKISELW